MGRHPVVTVVMLSSEKNRLTLGRAQGSVVGLIGCGCRRVSETRSSHCVVTFVVL